MQGGLILAPYISSNLKWCYKFSVMCSWLRCESNVLVINTHSSHIISIHLWLTHGLLFLPSPETELRTVRFSKQTLAPCKGPLILSLKRLRIITYKSCIWKTINHNLVQLYSAKIDTIKITKVFTSFIHLWWDITVGQNRNKILINGSIVLVTEKFVVSEKGSKSMGDILASGLLKYLRDKWLAV